MHRFSHSHLDRPLNVHLKLDTGMRRFGVDPHEAVALARLLAEHPAVRIEGIYSHFAESDDALPDRMNEQLSDFQRARATLCEAGIVPEMAHISNSAALLRNRAADLDMVRAGICLYGIQPSEHIALFEGMQPSARMACQSSAYRCT